MAMSFTPDITEVLARARADLRMGVPVVLVGEHGGSALMLAAETLEAQRLADLRALGGAPVLAITSRRAETLKARAYDNDLARVELPVDAGLPWVLGVADPADDLKTPMKGPLISARGGDASLHRLAIRLAKTARLLPAALVLDLSDAPGFAKKHNLTVLPSALAAPVLEATSNLHPVVAGPFADGGRRGRTSARVSPRRRWRGTLRHRNWSAIARSAGPGAAAFGLFHGRCAGLAQMRLRSATARRAGADGP